MESRKVARKVGKWKVPTFLRYLHFVSAKPMPYGSMANYGAMVKTDEQRSRTPQASQTPQSDYSSKSGSSPSDPGMMGAGAGLVLGFCVDGLVVD